MDKSPFEKIFIELNPSYIGKIDFLIEKGLYKSYKDFLEKAISSQLEIHNNTFEELKKHKSVIFGLVKYSAKDLEKIAAEGKKLDVKVIGGLIFSKDISPELAKRTISKICIAGYLRASKQILPIIENHRYTLLGNPYKEILRLKESEEEE